jgi:hypothetical protein
MLYTLFVIARGQAALTRRIFQRDLVVSWYPFRISEIHDFS